MNASPSENKTETPLPQEKIEVAVPQQKEAAPQPEKTKSLDDDPNWKALRETTKRERQRAAEAQKLLAEEKERTEKAQKEAEALKAALEATFSKGNPVTPYSQYQEPQEETESERIDKLVEAKLAKMQQQAERERIEKEQREYPDRLRREFSDFDQVISDENQDYLIYHYPEVAAPLREMPEGYSRWNYIYKAIKKFVPNNTTAKKEAARADANFSKPRSMSGTGLTQSGEAPGNSRLTEERKAANWARMQQSLRGVA